MNRRQRRFQLRAAGMLRVKNMYGPFTEVGKLWYGKTRAEGSNLHTQNTMRIEKQRDEYFAEKEGAIRQSLTEMGYSTKKVDLMIEAWVLTAIKDSETYRADRKRSQALLREAAQMK